MEEFNKKWFQVVWACLLLASVTINYIQRMSDALWAHSEAVQVLDTVLDCIILPMTVVLFIWYCIGLWRTSDRLFWRKCRRWGAGLAVGVVCAVALVLLVRYAKGDNTTINDGERVLILSVFAAGGLIYGIARNKFKHWRKEE